MTNELPFDVEKIIRIYNTTDLPGDEAEALYRAIRFIKRRMPIEPEAAATEPRTSSDLAHVKMRLAQIASGDYKACGHTAEEVAADALLYLSGAQAKDKASGAGDVVDDDPGGWYARDEQLDAIAAKSANPLTTGDAERQEGVVELLRDMRCQVAFSHVATIPIPLYERMKAAIAAHPPQEECRRLREALHHIAHIELPPPTPEAWAQWKTTSELQSELALDALSATHHIKGAAE